MALLQSPLLETYGTLLLLKETLEKAKKNTILGTHVQKSKIEQTITKLESEVKESLKRKRHVPTKAPVSKMQRRGRHDVPRSRSWHRRREEEESADELDFERPGGKATLTDDDIYSLARWLASAEGRRYWGKQEQLDWAGFAKIVGASCRVLSRIRPLRSKRIPSATGAAGAIGISPIRDARLGLIYSLRSTRKSLMTKKKGHSVPVKTSTKTRKRSRTQ
ncbi:hypothetical protein CALVIDRAFT_539907 [Calocera viscosa TUFC12733]|uniref:Uncharacterized protein n=1 Tax=Calocera viscosa (strain TUFC12733) TaxID=1330018 RepID=A0A167JCR4_CALVF|nr:hypothetical protein CALVIDRAFT_539907 [Calocera viscosa TUFC12733]